MNIIKQFNDTIDYLETVLDDEIDEKKVTQLSGYSYPMFSRLFSILTETTLSEYLRSRRLTEAAIILRDSDEKVIDIAFKFRYESSDSFGTAFKNFHGCTPLEVRNGKPFKLVSKVQLALSIRGGKSMNITIQKKKAFIVAGLNEQNINSSLCPSIWQKLFSKLVMKKWLSWRRDQDILGLYKDTVSIGSLEYLLKLMSGKFFRRMFET